MPTPDESVVRRVLSVNDRGMRIRLCMERAWQQVAENYPERRRWRRKTTTRGLMWEDSVDAVIEELEGDRGIEPIHQKDTVTFIADDTVLFRLKKAAPSLLSSNFPTQLALLFHRHEEDLLGHKGFHRVEVVHVFDRFQTALEWIGVVAREGKRVLWQYELPSSGAAVISLPPTSPTRPAADSVLRPATPSKQTKNDEEKK